MRAAASPTPRAPRAPCIPLAVCLFVATPAMGQSFTLMGSLPPYTVSDLAAISDDGSVVAGTHGNDSIFFTWTDTGGRHDLGAAIGISTKSCGISGNGRVVIGQAGGSEGDAFWWSQTDGYHLLGNLRGYANSAARDASFDGSVIVGDADNGSGFTPQAFRWTQSGGMYGLGAGTSARAVSGDGSTIVGSTGPSGNRPWRWTDIGGSQFLPAFDGTAAGVATAINHDGSIIVGQSGVGDRTTMWVNGVPTDLTYGFTVRNLSPTGVSDDGSILVGVLYQFGLPGVAGVWTPGSGMTTLATYLTARGVTIPVGVGLKSCAAVSADGRSFVGYTQGTSGVQGFFATIDTSCPADLDGDGDFSNGGPPDNAVTIEDLIFFLAGFELGDLSVDLDNGTYTGIHDGVVTIDDLLFFLAHFEAGC